MKNLLNTGRFRFYVHRTIFFLLAGVILLYATTLFNLLIIPLVQIPPEDDIWLLCIDLFLMLFLSYYFIRQALTRNYFSFSYFRRHFFEDWDVYLIANAIVKSSNSRFRQLQKNEITTHLNVQQVNSTLNKLLPNTRLFLEIALLIVGIVGLNEMMQNNRRLNHVFLNPKQSLNESVEVKFRNLVGKKFLREADSMVFKCRVNNQLVENVKVEMRDIHHTLWKSMSMNRKLSYFVSPKIPLMDSVIYRYTGELKLKYRANKLVKSDEYTLAILKDPKLKKVEFILQPPLYTGLPEERSSGNQTIFYCLRGTTVKMRAFFDRVIDSIFIFADDKQNLRFNNSNQVNYRFVFSQNQSLRINWKHYDSLFYTYPLQFEFKSLNDREPFIKVLQPQQKVQLKEELQVPFLVHISDDFGFSGFELEKKRARPNQDSIATSQNLHQFLRPGNDLHIKLKVDFYKEFLNPGETMKIRFKVRDNNPFKEQIAYSPWISVVLLSMEQLLKEIDRTKADYNSEMNQSTNMIRDLQKNLDKLLKKTYNPNTQKNREDLHSDVKYASDSLRKSIEKQKKLLGDLIKKARKILKPESIQKYSEIQDLVKKLLGHELLEKLEKLIKNDKKLTLEQLQKVLEKAKTAAEDFADRLEQIHNLFKKLEIEKQFDIMDTYYKELIENLKTWTENKKAQQQRQENSEKFKSQLIDKMDSTAQKLRNIKKQQYARELDSLKNELKMTSVTISNSGTGQNSITKMNVQKKQLAQIKEKFVKEEQQNVIEEIQRQILELIRYSSQQEKLNNKLLQANRISSDIPNLAIEQKEWDVEFNEITKALIQLQNQTFFIPIKINKKLRTIQLEQKLIGTALEQRHLYKIKPAAQKLLQNSNETIKLLIEAIDLIKKSNSSSGMQQFMERMQQLAHQQKLINQRSQHMMQQMGKGRLSKESIMKELAQLAAMQANIQKEMKSLSNSIAQGSGKKKLLEKLEKELGEIARKLKTKNLNPEVVQKQKNILRNMLEISQSLNTKDQSKKREAEAAKKYKNVSPEELNEEIKNKSLIWQSYLESIKNIQDPEMKKILKEYYEELLQKYSH